MLESHVSLQPALYSNLQSYWFNPGDRSRGSDARSVPSKDNHDHKLGLQEPPNGTMSLFTRHVLGYCHPCGFPKSSFVRRDPVGDGEAGAPALVGSRAESRLYWQVYQLPEKLSKPNAALPDKFSSNISACKTFSQNPHTYPLPTIITKLSFSHNSRKSTE